MKTIKKITLALSLCSVVSLNAWAQKPDKAVARVTYTLTHIDDTTAKEDPHVESMLLVVGNNASVFTSYDKINRNKRMDEAIQKQMKEQAASGGNFNLNLTGLGGNKPTTPYDIYNFANEKKLYTSERLINNYLIEDKSGTIAWKISKDTASFKGIKCQKATANFKGRSWTAWFSTEYPMSAGPWKLNGLPGLIIQAYDSKNEVKYELEGLEMVRTTEEGSDVKKVELSTGISANIVGLGTGSYFGSEIKIPSDASIITQKEMDKLKEIREKDPQGFARSQMGSMTAATGVRMGTQTTTSEIKSINITKSGPESNTNTKKKVLNNPIELPEKK